MSKGNHDAVPFLEKFDFQCPRNSKGTPDFLSYSSSQRLVPRKLIIWLTKSSAAHCRPLRTNLLGHVSFFNWWTLNIHFRSQLLCDSTGTGQWRKAKIFTLWSISRGWRVRYTKNHLNIQFGDGRWVFVVESKLLLQFEQKKSCYCWKNIRDRPAPDHTWGIGFGNQTRARALRKTFTFVRTNFFVWV